MQRNETRKFEAETLGLPPIRMVLVDVPEPDVIKPRKSPTPPNRKMETAIHKLIHHLKQENR
jgi:hypothetical protein